MGQAKQKKRASFPLQLISQWEAESCINFAVALARMTNWLLHVDWWTPSTDPRAELPIERLRPLRVYVADNHDQVFDVRGVKSFFDFSERTIRPLAIAHGSGAVRTRFYSEEKLKKLPLLHLPEAEKISAAQTAIRTNPIYLGSITPRTPPLIPAHHAAEFTFGRCAAYAEALSEVSGFEPVALLATRFHAAYGGAKSALGDYVHSFVMHPDGRAEDAWGITTIHEIAVRFGVAEFKVSASDHKIVVNNLTQNSPEQYVEAFDLAKSLLFTHRAQTNINP